MKSFVSSTAFATIVFWVAVVVLGIALWHADKSRALAQLPQNPACEQSDYDFSCYKRFYNELVVRGGTDVALDDIRKRFTEDEFVNVMCHTLMHVIGRAAADSSYDISAAFAQGSAFCLSGYYHGVVESFVARGGEEILTTGKGINELCAAIRESRPYSFDHFNCVHGIGHGIMAARYNDLPNSLVTCDHVGEEWEREACYGGAYMQNMMVDDDEHKTAYLKDDDPFYPCNAVDEKYREMCWFMQTSQVLSINGRNFSKAFSLCESLDEQYENICYQSLGRDASGDSSHDSEGARDFCMMGKTTVQRENCVVGAARDFVQVLHSDLRAKELCDLFSGGIQSSCLKAVEDYYATF